MIPAHAVNQTIKAVIQASTRTGEDLARMVNLACTQFLLIKRKMEPLIAEVTQSITRTIIKGTAKLTKMKNQAHLIKCKLLATLKSKLKEKSIAQTRFLSK